MQRRTDGTLIATWPVSKTSLTERGKALWYPARTRFRAESLADDPARAGKVIRQTEKTCLVFKTLGASRLCATQEEAAAAFRFAFSTIGPKDAVVVGMFQKHVDQIAPHVA
ncbi:MAG: hypothetical protein V1800_16755 [Candidatus Latescibacterota bacterium]